MRSLIGAALLLSTDATEETSLMQGLVARRGQLAPDSKSSRKDATARLMETATKMMKNGATPDVVTFIETTITEVNANVLSAIVEEHHRDQQLIYDLIARFDAAVTAMEACVTSVATAQAEKEASSHAHQVCRSAESIDCARSRRCEEELEELWDIVKREEEEMRRIHLEIHGEWCLGPAPPHPGLDDPFVWTEGVHSEGPETSESIHPYPEIELTDRVIEFRRFSVEYFGLYILQKPRVELAWENYNRKLIECAALEETWTLKVEECDDKQDALHDDACMHAGTNRQCTSNFGHEYHMTMVAYNDAVATVRQLEYDRKREWETLHIVTCLLETVYTHVIHSIDSGEPCPTTESHPEETEAEINYCHVIEESMTANLTIIIPPPPPPPDLPPPVPPPCTAEYIWQEHGSFSFEIQASHSQTIADEGLESYFTVLSAFGWAGCAAPKACVSCESTDLIVDPAYVENEVCKHHHGHLNAGQMDWDTFKCLSGDECIRAVGRCNGVNNCDDGSDELGCNTEWGVPALLNQAEVCNDPFASDVQFRCADNTCVHAAGKCNGVNNCADGSDEQGCATTTQGVTLEAMTGFTATIETPAVGGAVFYDRTYTFDSLGSFSGHSFIKMSNEDKHIRHSHVQMKLRLPQPLTVYIAKLDSTALPWLAAEGWELSSLTGVSYSGVRQTRHTDWSGELHEDHYGPGAVYQKTFPAGAIELRGNNGGDGSYVIFAAHPDNAPEPLAAAGIRLSGGTAHRGRVEIYHDGQWGTVCDDAFTMHDAMVACRQLGYSHAISAIQSFGGGSGQIWMDNIACDGTQSSLTECGHNGWGTHNCGHHEDAGVECGTGPAPVSQIRIAGGGNRGRLEIFHDNQWGTICDDAFGIEDANVACRQMGYSHATEAIQSFGGGSGQIWFDNVRCTGAEATMHLCDHNGWGQHNCGHHEDVGVNCVDATVDYNLASPGSGNTCPGEDVSEAECLEAAQSLLASGQSQGRTNLVAGSWGWVPPGCSIQTHFTHGRDGDFAAHYNRGNGNNDGGYTKVCQTGCQHLHNMDVVAGTFAHYGRDYSNSPSDEECSATCTADPECTAWVRQPSSGSCWISRQAVVTFEADSDRTTGLRCN